MKPDVLFWFYKDFATCRERLQRLRRLDKDVAIFALYGGPPAEAGKARDAVGEFVDDFYAYPHEREPKWKWKHGDQLIASWYVERGRFLEWDTICIMQWDMLILEPLEELFRELRPGEILLSGYRPVSAICSWWPWAKDSELSSFKELLRSEFNYHGELFACLFIVVCLPREFLKMYVAAGPPEVGFLEYKIPTLAKVFGIPVCMDHGFEPWWAANPATRNIPRRQRVLNAVGQEIPLSVVLRELASRDGKRLFHPVFKVLPAWCEKKYVSSLMAYLLPLMELISRGAMRLGLYGKSPTRLW